VKELFSSNLSGNLAYIDSHFGGISTTNSRLEAVGTERHDSLVLVKSTECEVWRAHSKVADSLKSKLQKILGGNGYVTLYKITDILSGSAVALEECKPELNSSDLTLFKYAPVNSCDVERSFSCCKTILSD
jgi:hypothetical protein